MASSSTGPLRPQDPAEGVAGEEEGEDGAAVRAPPAGVEGPARLVVGLRERVEAEAAPRDGEETPQARDPRGGTGEVLRRGRGQARRALRQDVADRARDRFWVDPHGVHREKNSGPPG